MEKRRQPIQRFKFSIREMLKFIDALKGGRSSKGEIADHVDMNTPKIPTLMEWAQFAGFTEPGEPLILSSFGEWFAEGWSPRKKRYLLQIVLYRMINSHMILDYVINEAGFAASTRNSPILHKGEVVRLLCEQRHRFPEISDRSEDDIRKGVNVVFQMLTNHEAFASLGLLSKKDRRRFQINPVWPEPEFVLYWLADKVVKGQTVLKINSITRKPYSIGRILSLKTAELKEVLVDLEENKFLQIEMDAGLNQIRLNSTAIRNQFPEEVLLCS